MKKLTHSLSNLRLLGLVLCGLVLSACSQEPEVFTGPFITRDGVIYDQNTNEPLTGIVEELNENGQLEQRTTYRDGKREGLWEGFNEDGNSVGTVTYRNGELVDWNVIHP